MRLASAWQMALPLLVGSLLWHCLPAQGSDHPKTMFSHTSTLKKALQLEAGPCPLLFYQTNVLLGVANKKGLVLAACQSETDATITDRALVPHLFM